jgi:Fe2+ transport system protein B
MGISPENWPATVGIFTGIFAKEAVVGTLDALYAQMDAAATESGQGRSGFRFLGRYRRSLCHHTAEPGGRGRESLSILWASPSAM